MFIFLGMLLVRLPQVLAPGAAVPRRGGRDAAQGGEEPPASRLHGRGVAADVAAGGPVVPQALHHHAHRQVGLLHEHHRRRSRVQPPLLQTQNDEPGLEQRHVGARRRLQDRVRGETTIKNL